MNSLGWSERYKLVNLSTAPHCLPAIASWQHEQWLRSHLPKQTDLFSAASTIPTDALSERQAQLRQHLAASLIPTTFLLLEKGRAVGSVSLVNYRRQEEQAIDLGLTPRPLKKIKSTGKNAEDKDGKIIDASSVWLTNMYVVPEHRKQGLAAVLLNRAEDYARSLQLKQIYLYAQEAEGYYKKRGWLMLKTVNLHGQKLKVLVRHL
jgi:GNAT superfamily N-acetyltransferase